MSRTGNFLLKYSAVILFVVVLVIISFVSPHFFSFRNVMNVLNQASALGILAIGITAVFITGGIDLSMPPVMALSCILAALAMYSGASAPVAILIALSVGCFLGFLNGYAIAYLRMIPFVVTLSIQVMTMGLCVLLTSKLSVPIANEAYLNLFSGKIMKVPVSVFYLVGVIIVSALLARKSIYARWVYAVGVNVETAKISGIPTKKVLLGVYIWSGLLCGVASLIISSRLASASATIGQEGLVLNIVSAAVVGGVSPMGGYGSPLGAVFGALVVTFISNCMNMMQVSYFTTLIVKGAVIILFVALDSFRHRR